MLFAMEFPWMSCVIVCICLYLKNNRSKISHHLSFDHRMSDENKSHNVQQIAEMSERRRMRSWK